MLPVLLLAALSLPVEYSYGRPEAAMPPWPVCLSVLRQASLVTKGLSDGREYPVQIDLSNFPAPHRVRRQVRDMASSQFRGVIEIGRVGRDLKRRDGAFLLVWDPPAWLHHGAVGIAFPSLGVAHFRMLRGNWEIMAMAHEILHLLGFRHTSDEGPGVPMRSDTEGIREDAIHLISERYLRCLAN